MSKVPLPSRAQQIRQSEEQDLFHQSRENAASLLTKVLYQLDGWELLLEKKKVKFYKKSDKVKNIYTITGITEISASLDEVMAGLYCADTASYCSLMGQLHEEKFSNGFVIADLPVKTDETGAFREQCGIKWLSFKPMSRLGTPSDYCMVDYTALRAANSASKKKGGDPSAERIGVQLFYSIERRECPDHSDSHKVSRGHLLPSGYIVYPTKRPGVVEVIFCWSIHDSMRAITKNQKKATLAITQSLCKLESTLVALRISSTGFIKPKNWVNDKQRTGCFICKESFGAFRRRHHCRICGDIACGKCSTVTSVKLPVVGITQVRICQQCLLEKEKQAKEAGHGSVSSRASVDSEVKASISSSIVSNSNPPPSSIARPATGSVSRPHTNSSGFSSSLDSDVSIVCSSDEDEMYDMTKYSPPKDSNLETIEDLESPTHSSAVPTNNDNSLAVRNKDANYLTNSTPFQYNLNFGWSKPYPKSPAMNDESVRVAKLRSLNILDTATSEEYDLMTQFSCKAFDCNMAFVSFIDTDREWLKSSRGISLLEFDRNLSLGAHTIMNFQETVILDLKEDVRFQSNPMVTGQPFLRFYAAYPIVTSEGFAIGTVAVADTLPRSRVKWDQINLLKDIANRARDLLMNSSEENQLAAGSGRPNRSMGAGIPEYSNRPKQAEQAQMQNRLINLLQKSYETGQKVEMNKIIMDSSRFEEA